MGVATGGYRRGGWQLAAWLSAPNCQLGVAARMSLPRLLLAIFFPPLAVLGKGCGSFILVAILTAAGWVPGVIAALIILNKEP